MQKLTLDPQLPQFDLAAIKAQLQDMADMPDAQKKATQATLRALHESLAYFFNEDGNGWRKAEHEARLLQTAQSMAFSSGKKTDGKFVWPDEAVTAIKSATAIREAGDERIYNSIKLVLEDQINLMHREGRAPQTQQQWQDIVKNELTTEDNIFGIIDGERKEGWSFSYCSPKGDAGRQAYIRALSVPAIYNFVKSQLCYVEGLKLSEEAFPQPYNIAKEAYVLLEWAKRSGVLGDISPTPSAPRSLGRPILNAGGPQL